MEMLSGYEQRFSPYCVIFVLHYDGWKCLFIWKCQRRYYASMCLFRGVNCVVTGQNIRLHHQMLVCCYFFFPEEPKGILGLSVYSSVTHCLSLLKGLYTHIPHASSIYRRTEPAEGRHHISTEVVNRPSEAFLEGVSSSAFIEPLSDY